jgi:hypothetical protein
MENTNEWIFVSSGRVITATDKTTQIVKVIEEFKQATSMRNGFIKIQQNGGEYETIKSYGDIGKFFNVVIEYDDHNVLCYYDPETEGWEALEDHCGECGYCDCRCCEDEEYEEQYRECVLAYQ